MSCQLLHRVDPEQNMARFYRVEMLPDLFGQVIVERRWGRIGGKGQFRTASYRSTTLAEAAASDWVRSKERRGYKEMPCASDQFGRMELSTHLRNNTLAFTPPNPNPLAMA